MKKYIFIDFDGVLNTERYHAAVLNAGRMLYDAYGPIFDPEAVENLRTVVDTAGAECVISSSWKLDGPKRMSALWKARKMPGILAGCTPNAVVGMDILSMNLDDSDTFAQLAGNGCEVKKWLEENAPAEADSYRYVIFDDVPDSLPEQEAKFIQVNPHVGITVEDAARAIIILNK